MEEEMDYRYYQMSAGRIIIDSNMLSMAIDIDQRLAIALRVLAAGREAERRQASVRVASHSFSVGPPVAQLLQVVDLSST